MVMRIMYEWVFKIGVVHVNRDLNSSMLLEQM